MLGSTLITAEVGLRDPIAVYEVVGARPRQ